MIKKILTAFLMLMLVGALSSMPAQAAQDWMQSYHHIETMLGKAEEAYAAGDKEGAKKIVNDSYYGVYETDGLEKAIRTTISSKNANLTEYQYSKLKKAIRDDAGIAAVKAEKDQLLSMMKSDISTLDSKGGGGGRWASFWPAFLILLREGMEAILIIVAIMAYLAKSGNKKYLNTVYNYSIAAVIASFASAYVFSVVLDTFTVGASRELIEGLTALFAVFVLLYMSFWMGSRVKASAWKQYLETMIHTTITTGRARSLGLAAFLAVYREGAEVILFYQALFNGASGDTDMIWFGFLAGALVLAVIFVFIQLGLFKIPLRAFFIVTSVLMYLMAVSFVGGGISELQEAQVISQTVIEASWYPNIDWLGLYPTVETTAAQLALLLLGGGIVFFQIFQAGKKTI